jgi:hypothetical protein
MKVSYVTREDKRFPELRQYVLENVAKLPAHLMLLQY